MRTRHIKPGLVRNEELAECGRDARFLFALLPMLADRQGRLEDRPRRIRAELFPYDEDVTGATVDAWLHALAARGFVRRYAVDGVAVVQVVHFVRHQSPHPNEVASVLPPHPENAEPPKTLSKSAKARLEEHQGADDDAPRSGAVTLDLDLDPDHSPSVSGAASVDADPPEPVVLEFPVVGGAKVWGLTDLQLAQWQATYPALDVLAECKRARAWLQANHLKTGRGMSAFLVRWLSRSQDRLPAKAAPAAKATPAADWEPFVCPHEPPCEGGSRWRCHQRSELEAMRVGAAHV